ncbi:nuclear transport factor 2 family protein [Rhodococcus sp. SGAir0479]|uniref:nuclear transport factor 2 family protein n=1 Tax=Rhodococcus sp. SGAir0479 TaxID=2567884 RepID=UPI0010CCF379|nr:nuclear transport factor 2 family protein [Rhodococcus sp. SGAir0479]QCQ92781.1 nuclear transport factor 2 family protein [Rhodococcus sp. SGAir0479]
MTAWTLERLGAVEAIRDLAHLYTHLIDEARLEEVADLFAHAVYGQCDDTGTPLGPVRDRDPEGVLAACRSFVQMHGTPPRPRTKHVVTNLRVDVADDYRSATSLSYFTVLQATEDLPLQPILSGRYFDAFAVRDGEWVFTQRLTCIDLVGDLGEHARRAL